MVRTSRTIHRINLYIRVITSIACTNSTTPHDYLRGFLLLLFFFAAVAIANIFLSILVTFFAIDGVIVVTPFSSPPSLLLLSPSSSLRSPRLRTSPADPAQTNLTPGWVCQLLPWVWYRTCTSTFPGLFPPPYYPIGHPSCADPAPFASLFSPYITNSPPPCLPCYYHSSARRVASHL